MMTSYKIIQTDLVSAILNELARQHPGIPADGRVNTIISAANAICAEYARQLVPAIAAQGLQAWMESDDTGGSSLYMASILSGKEFSALYYYPHGPDDLGRCIRLVAAVPEFKARISIMRDKGPEWAAVVDNWDSWVSRYNSQDEALYGDMGKTYDAYMDRALSTSMEKK